jgi:hypothetical protein
MKFDKDWHVSWSKTIGGSSLDQLESAKATSDKGFILAGSTYSNNGFIHNKGLYDAWILKIDGKGDTLWSGTFGGLSYDNAFSICEDHDGNYVFAGRTVTERKDDFWVVKLNKAGKVLWSKTYGGTNEDVAFSIDCTLDNGFIITGRTNSTDGDIHNNHGNSDILLIKTDANGILKWSKCIGGSGDDWGKSVLKTEDSCFVVSGFSDSNNGDLMNNNGYYDAIITKVDGSGNIRWTKTLGGSKYEEVSATIEKDRYYYSVGFTSSTDGDFISDKETNKTWIIRMSEAGNPDWLITCDSGVGKAIVAQSLKKFVIAGSIGLNNEYKTQFYTPIAGWLTRAGVAKKYSIDSTICKGDSILFSNKYISSEGNYADTVYTHVLYDSIINMKVSIRDSIRCIRDYSGIEVNSQNPHLAVFYPNPASDKLYLKNIRFSNASIMIFDIKGNMVISEKINSGTTDISNLSKGLYFVKVVDSGNVYISKLIKE